jgi:hypothetical protein
MVLSLYDPVELGIGEERGTNMMASTHWRSARGRGSTGRYKHLEQFGNYLQPAMSATAGRNGPQCANFLPGSPKSLLYCGIIDTGSGKNSGVVE